MVRKKTRQKKEDKEFKKIVKAMEKHPQIPERHLKVIQTSIAVLLLVDKRELYSIERDSETNSPFLLELSCKSAVRKPN